MLFSAVTHTPRLVQFIGQLYLLMLSVYLHVLASSPFTPRYHRPGPKASTALCAVYMSTTPGTLDEQQQPAHTC